MCLLWQSRVDWWDWWKRYRCRLRGSSRLSEVLPTTVEGVDVVGESVFVEPAGSGVVKAVKVWMVIWCVSCSCVKMLVIDDMGLRGDVCGSGIQNQRYMADVTRRSTNIYTLP
jgi:hypothetical protein